MSHPTVTLLAARAAEVPTCMRMMLSAPAGRPVPECARRRFVVTGVGAAEGPARFLVAVLTWELGLPAVFAPLSTFAGTRALPGDTLVVFSQGLSPNARLALSRAREFAHAVLFTAVHADRDGDARARLVSELAASGVDVRQHPPADEGGMLVRMLGPATATAAAARFAEEIARTVGSTWSVPRDWPERVAEAARQAPRDLPPGVMEGPLAIVTSGVWRETAPSHAWKILEALSVPEPHVWDVLGLAHGAFQEFHLRPITLLALDGPDVPTSALDRLFDMLSRDRHRLVRVRASLRGPLATLEHGAAIDALVLSVLAGSSRDLSTWPGQGLDGPLYGLGSL